MLRYDDTRHSLVTEDGIPTPREAPRLTYGVATTMQTYTYTGTFTVAGETFPYYTGNGVTPWYLFGGKTSAGRSEKQRHP